MTYSNLELQNLTYNMLNSGVLEEKDIDPLYRNFTPLNAYLDSGSTEQTYNMGERKFDIKDVKSWFKRADYVQYDAYNNYDVAIVKLKHFTGCNIIDEYLFHFYKIWINCDFAVVKSKPLLHCKEGSGLGVMLNSYNTEEETDLRNIKAEDLYYISFGINFKDIIKLVEELGEDFVYNENILEDLNLKIKNDKIHESGKNK